MEDLGVAGGRMPLVIFNACYDWPLLLAEAARCQRSIDWRPMFLDPRVIDLRGDTYRKGKRKLADVAVTYGVELVGAHGAEADALAAVRIMRAMLRLWPRFGTATLERLQDLQAEWFAAWRDHINEYWEPGKDGPGDRELAVREQRAGVGRREGSGVVRGQAVMRGRVRFWQLSGASGLAASSQELRFSRL
jgi:DNA polymerase III epsilon subunit-like protein